jgi:hypothetical protein
MTILEISNSIALRAEGLINSAKSPQSVPFSSWCRISQLAIVFVSDPQAQSSRSPVIDFKAMSAIGT